MSADEWTATAAVGTWAAVVVAFIAIAVERISRWNDRRDRDAAQARLVMVDSDPILADGLKVRLTNFSSEPIIGLELDEVVWNGLPDDVSWRVPPTIPFARASANVTGPGASLEVPVEFVNKAGTRHQPTVPGSFRARFSFHDARGLTWSRTAGRPPRRVKRQWWKFGTGDD